MAIVVGPHTADFGCTGTQANHHHNKTFLHTCIINARVIVFACFMTINYARYGQWSVAMDHGYARLHGEYSVTLPNELYGRRRRLVRARRLADEARSS
jgi:hypothetical protein